MGKQFNVLANFARSFTDQASVALRTSPSLVINMHGKGLLGTYTASMSMLRELSRQKLLTNFSDTAYWDGIKVAQFEVADDVSLSSTHPLGSDVQVTMSKGLAWRIQNGVSFDFDPYR